MAVDDGAKRHRTVSDLYEGSPGRWPDRWPWRVRPIVGDHGVAGRADAAFLDANLAPLERLRRQPLQPKGAAVGFDRREKQLATHGRADLAHAERSAGPARQWGAASPRPHVVALAVIGDEKYFIRGIGKTR